MVFFFWAATGTHDGADESTERTVRRREGESMGCYGVRGAIDVPVNRAEEILTATRALLERMTGQNAIRPEAIVSVIFSATADLDAVAPAKAARELGWTRTPLFCVQEMHVEGSLPRCIRVLMHVNGDRRPDEVRHVYLGAARLLRPDWSEEAES